ncbi:hypothetical protein Bca4012_014372 [Brassica carinata]
MNELTMVIAGNWVCGHGDKWDFIVDKNQMARLVRLYEEISLAELEESVLKEFKLDGAVFNPKLSYWPPTSMELATGITTPPVLITSDAVIKYYFQHLRVKGAMNLFAQFEEVRSQELNEHIDDSGMGFVTPAAAKYKTTSSVPSRFNPKPPHYGISCLNQNMFSTGGSSMSKRRCVTGAPAVNLDDVNFVREAEVLETELESGGGVSEEGVTAEEIDGCLGEDGVTAEEIDVRDIRPRGYDKEFWTPLLSGDYGGSNAVKAVYNEDEIVDGMLRKSGPRFYCINSNETQQPVHSTGGASGEFPGGSSEDSDGQQRTPAGVDGQPRARTRKLEDVADEEFDIPPLFDDTTYECSEIPDMDATDDDGQIYVGKVYGNKEDCQISLAIYAIKKQFRFKQTTTKLDSFVVQCPDLSCDWRVLAREIRGTGYYEIRKVQLDHSCPIDFRMGYKSRATSKVIASVYKSRFGAAGKGPVPRELQQLLLEDLKVSASYMKCYRAKEKAVVGLFGSEEDSYLKLPEYLHMLKLANPGTVADIETETDEDGDERFLYLFLAFGASIVGFRKLRLVLVVDGTHLGGKYKGVLLTASGQDANFQIFPLAYAIVDTEDEEAWTWFLQKLERILGDSPRLAIISDRATCIATAVKRVYPRAHHGYCIVHLARNVNSRYSNKGLAKIVVACATAYRPSVYKDQYAKIRSTSSDCGVYLGRIGVAHWTRANFPADRYNIMTSNIAEQLNKALVEGRALPVMELVIFIQRMMTR